MIHAREDYNRIQDPAGKIGRDEPVFLLRGKDQFAPTAIRVWAEMVKCTGDIELANHVKKFADDMEVWQLDNSCKIPDSPEVGVGKSTTK